METLFKFALLRAAVEQAEDAPSILLALDTPLQRALATLRGDASMREERRRLARAYVASAEFVADLKTLAFFGQWEAVSSALDKIERTKESTRSDVIEAVQTSLGERLSTLVERKELADDRRRLCDSLIAIKLLPEEHKRPVHRLVRILRDIDFVLELARNTEFPSDDDQMRRYRRRSISLAIGDARSGIVSTPALKDQPSPQPRDEEAARKAAVEAEFVRLRGLAAAVDELARLPPALLAASPLQATQESMPSKAAHPIALFEARLARQDSPTFVTAGPGAGQRGTFTGRSALRAEDLVPGGFRLADRAVASLSKETVAVLELRGIVPSEHAVDTLTENLRTEAAATVRSLYQLAGRTVQRSFKRFGGVVVAVKTPIASAWTDLVLGGAHDLALPASPEPADARVPDSHGSVKPAGIADLLVVKQQLLRYEPTEVAHIENVLMGERKQRDHKRRRETEQFTLRETELTSSEERELETTDRFEMVRETNETLRQSAALNAGLTISGRYGPTVEFSATAEGSTSRDRESATRTASTFSKETTQKSASKIAERVLQRETLRITTSVEESNSHVLDKWRPGPHGRSSRCNRGRC